MRASDLKEQRKTKVPENVALEAGKSHAPGPPSVAKYSQPANLTERCEATEVKDGNSLVANDCLL